MLMRKLWMMAAAMLLSLSLVFSAAAELSPQPVADDLAARNNAMIAGLKQLRDEGTLTQQAALALMQEHASPKLDFAKLTQRAMGKHWRKADDDARTKLQESFRQLLENTYAKLLSGYGGQEVKLISASSRANGGVSAVLEVQGTRAVMIEYICREVANGDYAVSDIKVEGISLVANYRRQFGAVIKKSGIEGLITKLQMMAQERAPKDA